MKVAFTGTKSGMSHQQIVAFHMLLDRLVPTVWLHGACVGADEDSVVQVHLWHTAKLDKVWVVACPGYFVKNPDDLSCFSMVAVRGSHEVRARRGMLERNRMMVNEAECLVATPYQAERQESGGTWFTIDYAKRVGKKVWLIRPDGKTLEE